MSLVTNTSQKQRLLPLDLARGVAALLVAFYHLQGHGWWLFNNSAPVLAVPFFFILSGFVLSYSYGELIQNHRMRTADFLRVRLARLYPLHFATMLVMLSLWFTLGAWPPAPLPANYPLQHSHFSILQFFESTTFTHALWGGANGFNSPSWSISIEFWCAWTIFALLVTPNRWLRAAIIVATVLAVVLTGPGRFAVSAWPPRAYTVGAALFVAGWALHMVSEPLARCVRRIPTPAVWSVAALILLAMLLPKGNIEGLQPLFYGAFLLLIAILAPLDVHTPLARHIMMRAGDWSYGIYLWHLPVICVLVWLDLSLARPSGFALLGQPFGDVLFATVTIAVSALGYRTLELPAKAWVNRRLQRDRGQQPTAGTIRS